MNALEQWVIFKRVFVENIMNTPSKEMSEIWDSSSKRTNLYQNTILPNIAKNLNLEFISEDFKIDYTLCSKSKSGTLVPLVYVESENVASSACHEIRKLCCLYAPLKVLITCCEWEQREPYWSKGMKEELSNRWSDIINSFYIHLPQESTVGVVIGERAGCHLRFYSMRFSRDGAICEPSSIIFDVKLD